MSVSTEKDYAEIPFFIHKKICYTFRLPDRINRASVVNNLYTAALLCRGFFMKILGVLGSPRTKGKCSRLLSRALEGAASTGADVKKIDLIKCTIKYCIDCRNCWTKNPDLPVGTCVLKDDMAAILDEYITSDGYIFASPVYDVFVTALMKTFLERKIALTFREKDDHGKLPGARSPAHFKKMASLIVTANCTEEFKEVMGDPCFEAMESHLMIEQVETVDRFYVGGIENITDKQFAVKLTLAYQAGIRLVESIRQAQKQ